jgi:flavin-dependent dehydrogenase
VGTVRGGYGWIFPRLDHLNVGIVGWRTEGPQLRKHLHRLARSLGLDPAALENVRGYRLRLRSPGDPLSKGRCILIGDAAGLNDPLSGEGIHSAFLSAKLGSEAVAALLHGKAQDPSAYSQATLSTLGRVPAASWGGKAASDRFPRASYHLLRTPQAWRAVTRIFQGRTVGDEERLFLPCLLAKLTGNPGRRYLQELAR